MDPGEHTFIQPLLKHDNVYALEQIPYFVTRYGFLVNLLIL